MKKSKSFVVVLLLAVVISLFFVFVAVLAIDINYFQANYLNR